ncbi:MAG: hypothetical protein WC391_05540 [Methanoregula sp.]|jgi:uncharacterized protein (DUF427 family)
MKKSTILIVLFLLGSALICGCTFPGSSRPAPTATPTTSAPPATSELPTPVVTGTIPASTYIPLETILTTEQTTRVATDNPYLRHLEMTKRVFPQNIPNCPMQQVFPAIAKDSKYGIQQVVPKLSQVSEHEYRDFLLDYTTGTGDNQKIKDLPACVGVVNPEPNWNFVEVLVVLDPTNVRASNYTISVNVRSDGDVIAQFKTTQTLVIDKQLVLTSYIPMKTSEMDLFDSVDVTYTRLTY